MLVSVVIASFYYTEEPLSNWNVWDPLFSGYHPLLGEYARAIHFWCLSFFLEVISIYCIFLGPSICQLITTSTGTSTSLLNDFTEDSIAKLMALYRKIVGCSNIHVGINTLYMIAIQLDSL